MDELKGLLLQCVEEYKKERQEKSQHNKYREFDVVLSKKTV
jgi:hypothetical protein